MKLKINFKQARDTSAGDINSLNLLVFLLISKLEIFKMHTFVPCIPFSFLDEQFDQNGEKSFG